MIKYLIAGSTGLAGSAICRKLEDTNESYAGISSKDLDLKDYDQTLEVLKRYMPQNVVIAAAKVGGIKANNTYPVEFLNENILIGMNLINASFELKIPNVVFLGSSCVYPKFAEQPMKEQSLMTGPLEETNSAYAIAKIACIELIKSYRKQHGLNWFSVMPTNLYGENDNFDLENSHVMPAILRKIHEAKLNKDKNVPMWGSGNPKREFMNSNDLADAIIFLINNNNQNDIVNIGVGYDITIRELAEKIAHVVGYEGEFSWDLNSLDGPPQKLLDSSTIFQMGWKPKIDINNGIRDYYDWYVKK
jgi:GDP-L-fucose synthase